MHQFFFQSSTSTCASVRAPVPPLVNWYTLFCGSQRWHIRSTWNKGFYSIVIQGRTASNGCWSANKKSVWKESWLCYCRNVLLRTHGKPVAIAVITAVVCPYLLAIWYTRSRNRDAPIVTALIHPCCCHNTPVAIQYTCSRSCTMAVRC